MKILLLTHSYPDENSGWRGLFIREQALALSREHDVIVVYFKVDYSRFGPFLKYSFRKKEDAHLTEYTLTTCRSFPVINQWKYLSDTYRFIKREILAGNKIDIVHSHLSYPAGFLGTIIQKKLKIPNIVTEHSWITNYFRSPVHKISVHYTLKNACAIIAVSNVLSDNIKRFYNRKTNVIPNVVNTDSFQPAMAKNTGTLNIGMLGGMGNYLKGFDVMLNAVSLLNDMDLKVHIGGTGKYLAEYKEMVTRLGISDKCIFYGEIKREKKSDFYANLDVYVMSSRLETFGVVVVEAMASGLPVISTRCGGPEEIITPETGMLVENANPSCLADAIRTFREKPGQFDRNFIRKYAVDNYGQQAFVKKITALYIDVLKNI